MKTINAFSILLACLILGHSINTEARTMCGSTATSCYFTKMPLYNQLDPKIGPTWLPNGPEGSQLCGPTSNAMALQGVVSEAKTAIDGWTKTSFIGKTPINQIINEAQLMGTSPTGGTSLTNWKKGLPERKSDFDIGDAGGTTSFAQPSDDTAKYISIIKTEKAAISINYGHYKPVQSVKFGKNYTTYVRNGGHVVAVNGYSGGKLLIFNPWGAVREWRTTTALTSGCNGTNCVTLPGSKSKVQYLFIKDGVYKIIDHHIRLWAE